MKESDLAGLLSGRGLRPTRHRIAVYRRLAEYRGHPSADMIYSGLSERFPGLSRTTVYNALNSLVSAGIVRMVPITPEEQRFDADMSEHGHFLCGSCGCISDFAIDSDAVRGFCPQSFECTRSDLLFFGKCSGCLEAERDKSRA